MTQESTQEPNHVDEGLDLKAYIRNQSSRYIERIKSDVECCKVSGLSLADSLTHDELEENHDNNEKKRMFNLILEKKDNLEVICYTIERIVDRFEICEQSMSDCFHAKQMLDSAIRVYKKISWEFRH